MVVIRGCVLVRKDFSTKKVLKRGSRDSTCNWSSSVNFLLDHVGNLHQICLALANHTIFRHSGVWIILNRCALFCTIADETTTCTANVYWGACCINMLTEPFGGFGTAGNIRVASIKCYFPIRLDPLVSTCVTSSMAAASDKLTTVQQMLNGKVDVISLSVAGDLDTIS